MPPAGAQSLQRGLLGREARRQVLGAPTGVSRSGALAGSEAALEEPVAVFRERALDPGHFDEVHSDADDAHGAMVASPGTGPRGPAGLRNVADLSSILAQARQHCAARRFDQARSVLARPLQKHADDADLNSAMAYVAGQQGQVQQALFYARRAYKARANDADFVCNLGHIIAWGGQAGEAAEMFKRAIALRPDHLDAAVGLAGALELADRTRDCIEVCREASVRHPNEPRLVYLHAATLRRLGRMPESNELLERALRALPDHVSLAQEVAFNSNYTSGLSPRQVFEAHRRFGRLISAQAGASTLRAHRPEDPERRLRIGFMSPDFREHSVAYYAEPVIEGIDRSQFEVFCYHLYGSSDEVTARFRRLAGVWRESNLLNDDELGRRIVEDRIDVLVELTGLTTHARPALLARKPAPVILTYIGYPNTIGLPSVDYRFVDSLTDPPGDADACAVERLVRLDPCFLCYRPPAAPPAVSSPPSLGAGSVTFGSFNSLLKLSDEVLVLWSRVLRDSPGSRLVLKNWDLASPDVREGLLARMSAAGADPSVIELLPYEKKGADHLATYARIDIALDTYPYHGTTTTCEALLMGVPVVSLMGDRHASRVGLSLLSAVGLPHLAAASPDEFVRTTVQLARDRQSLASLRGSLRDRLLRSPLCDAPSHSKRFNSALRDIWRAACGGAGGAGAGRKSVPHG